MARQCPGSGTTSAGRRSAPASARVGGHVVSLGHGEQEPGIGLDGQPDVGRRRDEVEVDADRADDDHRVPVEIGAHRPRRHRLLEVGAGPGALDPSKFGRPHEIRMRDHDLPQPPLGRDALERMALGAPGPMPAHGGDHLGQGGFGREVAVDHGECLTIVAADPDIDPGANVVDDHSSDLEAQDLADDDPVLDDDVGPRRFEHRDEGDGLRMRIGRRRQRLGLDPVQLAPVEPPHDRCLGEQSGSPGQQPGVVLDDQVEPAEVTGPRPRQAAAEHLGRFVVGQDPGSTRGCLDQGRAPRKGRECAIDVAGDGGQLGPEQRRSALGVEEGVGYDLALRFPYRRSNLSMRPPVSTSFCLPV